MATVAQACSGYRYYRVEGDRGAYVAVDPDRAARDGDLVLVDQDGAAPAVGQLVDAGRDPLLMRPGRAALRLNGRAVLGVVALVVSAT